MYGRFLGLSILTDENVLEGRLRRVSSLDQLLPYILSRIRYAGCQKRYFAMVAMSQGDKGEYGFPSDSQLSCFCNKRKRGGSSVRMDRIERSNWTGNTGSDI